jgi:hypothetical protein
VDGRGGGGRLEDYGSIAVSITAAVGGNYAVLVGVVTSWWDYGGVGGSSAVLVGMLQSAASLDRLIVFESLAANHWQKTAQTVYSSGRVSLSYGIIVNNQLC